ncbi:hypothetical protein CYLTODRAFT_76344 [Cylindrobasidium torrendii FP15055 ss-10]|uniref:DUF6533 domain-containing protein n=1 Tax=Cylindrobasidium torrendii FP15055 ss-10 TaxID=1314674 RepID=A0A0D7B4C6_9AGAR|nr:hypothetical protein CYLTODRAFT_76344 [Cylindrobasidium torrendii FP15055 ss-10]
MSLPSAVAVTSIRYTSTSAIALIAYDHLLTVDEEIAYIWKPDSTPWPGRAAYLVYRYFTEGVLLYSAYEFGGFAKTMTIQVCLAVLWIFVLSATLFVGILQFIVTINVYRLWDSKPRMANILLCVFALCFSATISLAVASTALITRSSIILHVNETVGDACLVGPLPRTVPAIFGTLLALDLFIIGLSLYRALEMPRRSQSELITNIQRDGALYHIGVSGTFIYSNCRLSEAFASVQWLVIFVASIHLDPYTFFSILTSVSSFPPAHCRVSN